MKPAQEPSSSTQALNWAVIGAGATGLSVARRLAEAGRSVTVYEREGFVGGQAGSFEVEPGLYLERFYHHVFHSDQILRRTYQELGLVHQLSWTHPVTATFLDGKMEQLDSPISLLRFRGLPLTTRLRMGATLAALRLVPRGEWLEGRAAAPWLRRWMGRASYDRIWRPLFEGKFGAATEEVGLPWFWARVHDRTSALGYSRGGFRPFYEGLAERVRANGGSVRLNTVVQSVERTATGYIVHARGAGGDERASHDEVISTLPPRLTADLAPDLPAS